MNRYITPRMIGQAVLIGAWACGLVTLAMAVMP